jgi:rhomboid protease GluP
VEDATRPDVEVFRGSQAASYEFGLVLDAKGIGYERVASLGDWSLWVTDASSAVAVEELRRYAAERSERPAAPPPFVPYAGSGIGAAAYALVLIMVAYCAGISLFEVDWLSRGAIVSQSHGLYEWWRPVTALTLHVDQEHLLGNLLFGAGVGALAGRMFGPGIAWLCILLAGTLGNFIDMSVAPLGHRAIGASTAVFAGLGLLAGFGWSERLSLRARRFYRWGPLFAGLCLLALFGAGAENRHVDVLGHLLGFAAGVVFGWGVERLGFVRSRSVALQMMAGCGALLIVLGAWLAALHPA